MKINPHKSATTTPAARGCIRACIQAYIQASTKTAVALRHKAYISANTDGNKFRGHRERDQFIHAFVDNDNKTRLKCLGYKAPLEALEETIRIHKDQAGHNTNAGDGGPIQLIALGSIIL